VYNLKSHPQIVFLGDRDMMVGQMIYTECHEYSGDNVMISGGTTDPLFFITIKEI
jgi:hypothetical protein